MRHVMKLAYCCKLWISGLYYKLITIIIDATSVMLQIVASLTIVIDDAS